MRQSSHQKNNNYTKTSEASSAQKDRAQYHGIEHSDQFLIAENKRSKLD
jgi:hypothetical protein